MPRKFSLAYLTIPSTHPIEQIRIAKECGYDFVSLRTIPMGLQNEASFIMEKDTALFSATKEALKEYDMRVLDIELARIREDLDTDFDAAFEKGAQLGATNVLSSIWTTDHGLSVDRCGQICEKAAQFSLTVNLEFVTFAGVANLQDAVRLLNDVGACNLKIMVDIVHAHRSGVTAQALEAVEREKFGFIHLCDCPAYIPPLDHPEMIRVAREGRLYLGEGGADVVGMLSALPSNPCSIELPNAEMVLRYGVAGHARQCIQTAKAFLQRNGLD